MHSSESSSAPTVFTIRCAGCDGDAGLHQEDCPSVLAVGYDSGSGAASMRVFPRPGSSFGRHPDALGALRFYSAFGPVELHRDDGTVIGYDEW